MSPRAALAVLAVLGAAGCGSMVEANDAGSTEDTGSSTTALGSSDGPVATTTTSTTGTSEVDGTSTSSTSTPDDDGYEEDDGGTGCTFTCPNPPPPTPPPGGGGGGGFSECDLTAQDCPEGEKCMPWANDGGDEWNATRCSPIADAPTQAGELCTVEGSGTSGIDDCDLGLVCWQVDPETNMGVCHAMCGLELPDCEPSLVCGGDDFVPLCIEPCDPLDPASCPAGQACAFFLGTALVCQPELDGAAEGMPCDAAIVCDAGTLCSYDAALDCGNGVGQGCCAVPCDVNDPGACAGLEICVPWFPLPPPPELAYLGICAPP
jgi:hypothetical protein